MSDLLPPETSVPAAETPARRMIEENLRSFAKAAARALAENTARAQGRYGDLYRLVRG